MASSSKEKVSAWAPRALMNLKLISDVQLSPDHTSTLFVVTESIIKEGEKGTVSSRIYKTNKAGQATAFSSCDSLSMQPRWSPDGEWIAFLSTRTGIKQLYLISATGGEARTLTQEPQDVQLFSWSPDGKKIAFIRKDQTEKERSRVKTNGVSVYRDKKEINRLWLVDPFAQDPSAFPLTPDDLCVRGAGDLGTLHLEFDWSFDSKHIVFTYTPDLGFDFFGNQSNLALVDVATKKVHLFKKRALYEISPRFSPDALLIGYLTSNAARKGARLAICKASGEEEKILPATPNEGAFFAGPSLLGWSKEGKHLLFFEPSGTKYHLLSVPVDGGVAKPLNTGSLFVKEPALSFDKTKFAFVGQTPSTPPEAWVTSLEPFAPTQISSLNEAFLTYPKIETTSISWSSSDGLSIDGLLTYPLGYNKQKKYPLLLMLHGGPAGLFDETFVGTVQPYPIASFAEKGFLILRPNPRGSEGKGKSFRCGNYNDWGGGDFADVVSGVNYLIEQGIADAEKLGVMGWSYGGYLTAWTISQTSIFKAASMGAGVSNLVSLNGTTDLHSFLTNYLGDFHQSRSLYEERSPINYISNITTPCLIQQGTDDKRVPSSQAYEFYHALERCGKTASLVLYPGMEHRIIEPHMQLDAMERNLAWFEHYLQKGAS